MPATPVCFRKAGDKVSVRRPRIFLLTNVFKMRMEIQVDKRREDMQRVQHAAREKDRRARERRNKREEKRREAQAKSRKTGGKRAANGTYVLEVNMSPTLRFSLWLHRV